MHYNIRLLQQFFIDEFIGEVAEIVFRHEIVGSAGPYSAIDSGEIALAVIVGIHRKPAPPVRQHRFRLGAVEAEAGLILFGRGFSSLRRIVVVAFRLQPAEPNAFHSDSPLPTAFLDLRARRGHLPLDPGKIAFVNFQQLFESHETYP